MEKEMVAEEEEMSKIFQFFSCLLTGDFLLFLFFSFTFFFIYFNCCICCLLFVISTCRVDIIGALNGKRGGNPQQT